MLGVGAVDHEKAEAPEGDPGDDARSAESSSFHGTSFELLK